MFFFFNDTATTEIYTLSLHDALPISAKGAHHILTQMSDAGLIKLRGGLNSTVEGGNGTDWMLGGEKSSLDRKSTRLNSSHANISYAVFCLKKKKKSIVKSTAERRSVP